MRERLTRLLGTEVGRAHARAERGYTVAFHAIAELADGRTAFVKAATEPVTAEFIRDEQRVSGALEGPFMPALLALDEDEPPLLVLEDLRAAHWPPPWEPGMIEAVRETLARWPTPTARRVSLRSASIATSSSPAGPRSRPTPPPSSPSRCAPSGGSAEALPLLREASEAAPIDGDAVLHLDVRSDNLCIAERGAVLVDWNHACVGNADLDVACWLPSLRLEGGPEPEEILPGAGGFAALLAGFFGCRAGLPAPPTAPTVRDSSSRSCASRCRGRRGSSISLRPGRFGR